MGKSEGRENRLRKDKRSTIKLLAPLHNKKTTTTVGDERERQRDHPGEVLGCFQGRKGAKDWVKFLKNGCIYVTHRDYRGEGPLIEKETLAFRVSIHKRSQRSNRGRRGVRRWRRSHPAETV